MTGCFVFEKSRASKQTRDQTTFFFRLGNQRRELSVVGSQCVTESVGSSIVGLPAAQFVEHAVERRFQFRRGLVDARGDLAADLLHFFVADFR